MKPATTIICKQLLVSGAVIASIWTSGCTTLEMPSQRQSRQHRETQLARELALLRQEHSRSMASLANLRADITLLQENQQRLSAHIEDMRGSGNTQSAELQQLQAQMQRQQSNLESWRRQLAQLEKALAAEGEQRVQAIKKVIETVSAEISTAYESVRGSGGNEYTVQRGDTLSAIAKAFGVTVDSLKQSNNLKTDIIRPGQVLLIPNQ